MKKNALRIIAMVALMAALSGCTEKMKMEAAYKAGHYRVTEFVIKPANQAMASDPHYQDFKRQLTQRLVQVLAGQGESPPDVRLTVEIQQLVLSTGTLKTILIGDNMLIRSQVSLSDVQTGTPVGRGQSVHTGAPVGGLGGVIANAVVSEDWQRERLIANYAENVKKLLYTKEEKK